MTFAPIALFVYNRPWHTQQTVEALQKNDLADQSELFIYSDGPRNEIDAVNVEKVREYLQTITGFKTITIFKRANNYGLANSIISGVTDVIDTYGKVIVLEDDLVSSPGLLIFLNKGLDFYQETKNIFCISGYNFPPSIMKIPSEYPHKIYLSPRNGSWGWATWKDRWHKSDWGVSDYPHFSSNKILQHEFNYGGEDLSLMLKTQMEGKIDSWSIRWCYTLFKNKGYCIYPVLSFIDNIGLDGTGTHCFEDRSNRNKNLVLNQDRDVFFPEKIGIDNNVMEQFRHVFRRKNRLLRFFQYGKGLCLAYYKIQSRKFR